ncbi:hypothetical protein Tco_0385005 [Tanacetum coccineum]
MSYYEGKLVLGLKFEALACFVLVVAVMIGFLHVFYAFLPGDTAKYHDPTLLFEHFLITDIHPNAKLRPVEDAFSTRKKWQAKSDKTYLMDLKVMEFRSPPIVMVDMNYKLKYLKERCPMLGRIFNVINYGNSCLKYDYMSYMNDGQQDVALSAVQRMICSPNTSDVQELADSFVVDVVPTVSTEMGPSTVADVIRESPENKCATFRNTNNEHRRPTPERKPRTNVLHSLIIPSVLKSLSSLGGSDNGWFVSAAHTESDMQKAYESLTIIAASVLTEPMLQVEFTEAGVCHGFALWIDWVMDSTNNIVMSTGRDVKVDADAELSEIIVSMVPEHMRANNKSEHELRIFNFTIYSVVPLLSTGNRHKASNASETRIILVSLAFTTLVTIPGGKQRMEFVHFVTADYGVKEYRSRLPCGLARGVLIEAFTLNLDIDYWTRVMESSDKLLSNISTRVKKTDGKLFRKDGVYVHANWNVQLDVPTADDQPQVVTSKEHMITKNILSVEQNAVQIECDADVIRHSKPVPIQPQVTTPKEHTSNCPINVPSAGKSAAQSECQAAVTGHSKPLSFASMVLTLGAIDEVSTRFENTLYGYFIGKRLAFPIVENYVKNAWEKYGIERVMLQNGFFFFQFATKEGMERVLENGPWLIRLVPIILNIWTPNARLKKDEITTVPIWVKLHNVPIVAYSEIGLSLITTHIGKPIMLDGYTSNMCVNSWGHNSYARALIEVSAKSALTDSMVVAIPFKNGSGHSMETINNEYEWQPPRCDTCKIFEHNDNQCPKKEQVANQNKELNQNKNLDDGFVEVTRRNGKGKLANNLRQASTSHVSIPKTNPSPINNITNEKGGSVDVNPIKDPTTGMNKPEINIISTNNSFAALLETDEALDGPGDTWKTTTSVLGNIRQDSDSEEVENIIIDQPTFMGGRMKPNISKGASTPSDDKAAGSSSIDIAMRDFQECVEDIEVTDVNSSGLRYTWNQKPKGADGILKKIDRIMANMEFNDIFVGSSALFQPYHISDHSSAILRIPMLTKIKPKPFKFSNILIHNTRFKDVVRNSWQMDVSGFWMFKVVQKLKFLKKLLHKLLYDQGNLHENVKHLCHKLDEAQRALDADPFNLTIREDEAAYLQAFNDALLTEECFLKQKAKIEWLHVGDSNTAYFHKVVKSRASRNCIDSITILSGTCIDGDQYPLRKFVMLFFLWEMTSLPHTAAFFKEAWDIIAHDVIKAVQEFFVNGSLLKELNHTIIALILKVAFPLKINDYRPISCCNILFKCISKIISNRIKDSLATLISSNQSAFVPGRRITDNILLTQELMHNYHLDRGPPKFAFKVDIQKAYDTVDWGCLHKVLIGFGFHPRMIGWIMECDPISPYLFTLVMEVLTLMLRRKVSDSDSFTYHHHCSDLNIINLCFADDLYLFAHGDVTFTRVIIEALDEFKYASGLGKLPVKYLGVPLVSSRLIYRDWKELVENGKSKINDWKNKFLSFAEGFSLCNMFDEERLVPQFMGIFVIMEYSWGWKKILQVRPLIRQFIWYRLGDGNMVSAWFDRWCLLSPLSDLVTPRDIHRAGFDMSTKVHDVIINGNWKWPNDWLVKYPPLYTIPSTHRGINAGWQNSIARIVAAQLEHQASMNLKSYCCLVLHLDYSRKLNLLSEKLSSRCGSGRGLKIGFEGSSSANGSSPAALRASTAAFHRESSQGIKCQRDKNNSCLAGIYGLGDDFWWKAAGTTGITVIPLSLETMMEEYKSIAKGNKRGKQFRKAFRATPPQEIPVRDEALIEAFTLTVSCCCYVLGGDMTVEANLLLFYLSLHYYKYYA